MRKSTCLELLRRHMEPDAYTQLLHMTATRGAIPVEYDAAEQRFEPALDVFDPEAGADDGIDHVFTACDILTAHAGEVDLASVGCTTCAQTGVAELVFDFDSDDPVLHAFLQLSHPLEQDPAFDIDIQRQAATTQVIFTVHYTSEEDYQRKKDQVYLNLDITRRRIKGNPFQGSRL